MDIEPITMYEFTVVPMDIKFPVCRATFNIVAKNRKEAELNFLNYGWKLLDQNHTVQVREIMQGFKEVINDR